MKELPKKKCAMCEKKFVQFRSTDVCCSYVCQVKYMSEKEIAKRHKECKVAVNESVTKLESIARRWFQKWIRFRDRALPCISCGSIYAKWDSGHYFKAELYSGLIFDEMNVNKQCAYCNGTKMHGNLSGYRIGLVKKYGKLAVEGLEEISDSMRGYKYTRLELKEIIEKYKAKLNESS